jgi:hypothetical protein
VVLTLLLIGLAVALDPVPLTACLVVLPSARGVRKGAGVRVRVAGVPGYRGHRDGRGYRQ